MAAALTRKATGKGRVGSKKSVALVEWFTYWLNQRKNDPGLVGSELAAAERQLLLKWDTIPSSGIHVDAVSVAVAPDSASATAASAGGASSSKS
eukprot:4773646-Pleurochrysis_carterae.AAC.1